MNLGNNTPEIPQTDTPAAIAERYGLDCVQTVSEAMLDSSLVKGIPVEWLRTNILLPVMINGEHCILTANPSDITAIGHASAMVGMELAPVVAPREAILAGIAQCYFNKDETPESFLKDIHRPDINLNNTTADSDMDLLRAAEKTPVTQLVNLILLEAVKRGVSDIHIEPFESRLRLRYRIDGVLYEQNPPPKHMEESLVSRLKVMAKMDIAERRLPQDGMARVRVGDREIDVRISTIPVAEGERMVMRLLDKKSALLPLESLGMEDDVLAQYGRLLKNSQGMIIVAGPTGSGKTTTLYASMSRLDSSRLNILTIEEPIEYQLDNIGQIQVKPKIGLSFASGLRHILRQDPDIILVGETRDLETAEIAVRASLTGHLVFTTLHTGDAPGAVMRLIDIGVDPRLIAACLKAVVSQRLLRKLCPACSIKRKVTAHDLAGTTPVFSHLQGRELHFPQGCPACIEGYKGRIGMFELMIVEGPLRDYVREAGINAGDIRHEAEKHGMTGMLDDGFRKAFAGLTSIDEIISATRL